MRRDSKVKVFINNNQRFEEISMINRLIIRRCCRAVLEVEEIPYKTEVSLFLVDNQLIKKLNETYRKKPIETDVLSFPLNDVIYGNRKTKLLGDIVISIPMAKQQSLYYNHSFTRELAFLTVHGMLHLLGYDHEKSKKDSLEMEKKQKHILECLGIYR